MCYFCFCEDGMALTWMLFTHSHLLDQFRSVKYCETWYLRMPKIRQPCLRHQENIVNAMTPGPLICSSNSSSRPSARRIGPIRNSAMSILISVGMALYVRCSRKARYFSSNQQKLRNTPYIYVYMCDVRSRRISPNLVHTCMAMITLPAWVFASIYFLLSIRYSLPLLPFVVSLWHSVVLAILAASV